MQALRQGIRVFIAALLLVCCLPLSALAAEEATSAAIEVSAEGDVAKAEGSPFALSSFDRAQVGTSRSPDGEYRGYLYYVSESAGNVTAIAVADYVVVYVPSEASNVGFRFESEEDTKALKSLLIALDNEAVQGAQPLSSIDTWYFTNDLTYQVDALMFTFDQELKEGQVYASVIGEDGSDITDPENPLHNKPSFADFGKLIPAEEAHLAVAPTGFAAFKEFLQDMDYGPLFVTLKTTGTAIIFIFILGLAAAYFSLRIPPRAQAVADSIFTIPMVLPPTVCGFLLLLAFGRNTALGQWFIDIGFPLVFSWQATVLAAIVVAFPLMYRSARGAFEGLDVNMLDAARTLGWSNRKIFFRLMLPLSWSSIAAGTVLAFARALGEFGATLFLAGNYAGITRTIPIAIYFEWMNGNTDVAIFWTIVIIIISFIVILFINVWGHRTTRYRRRAED